VRWQKQKQKQKQKISVVVVGVVDAGLVLGVGWLDAPF
jgi:hypothetical protein